MNNSISLKQTDNPKDFRLAINDQELAGVTAYKLEVVEDKLPLATLTVTVIGEINNVEVSL